MPQVVILVSLDLEVIESEERYIDRSNVMPVVVPC